MPFVGHTSAVLLGGEQSTRREDGRGRELWCARCMCLVWEPVWPRMYVPAPGPSSQVVKLGAALPLKGRLQRSQTTA